MQLAWQNIANIKSVQCISNQFVQNFSDSLELITALRNKVSELHTKTNLHKHASGIFVLLISSI